MTDAEVSALWHVIGQATAPRSTDINPHLIGVEPLDAIGPDAKLLPHLHPGPARHMNHEREARRAAV
jgi:hypothetical protein